MGALVRAAKLELIFKLTKVWVPGKPVRLKENTAFYPLYPTLELTVVEKEEASTLVQPANVLAKLL